MKINPDCSLQRKTESRRRRQNYAQHKFNLEIQMDDKKEKAQISVRRNIREADASMKDALVIGWFDG